MKIILLKDVAKLGKKFDTKDVSSGFALNSLIPQGLAVSATPEAIKKISVEKKVLDAERKIHLDLLLKNIGDLDGVNIIISAKANNKGHLFAGLHREVIVEEIFKQTKLELDPSFILLDEPLKTVGEHAIQAEGGGKKVKFTVTVEGKEN